jgi:hypothetical protein
MLFRKILSFTAITGTLLLSGCKPEDVIAPILPVDICALPNGYLKWSDAGTSYCGTTLFADEAIEMTINAVSLNGPTLTMQLDHYSLGTHILADSVNTVLYTSQLGLAYQSTDANPGTLTISSFDNANKQIKGNFDVTLKDPTGVTGNKHVTGSFSVYFTN